MPRAHRPAPAPAPVPVEFRVFNEIGIVEQLARNRFERVLPAGLSVAQFSVLNHIVRLGGTPSLVALARAFRVSKPAMGKLVRKLAEQGLVDMRADPEDARGKRVSITAAGVATHGAAIAALQPELARLRGALGGATFEAMLPGLERLRT